MILKASLLIAAVFVQANQVLSQGPPPQQQQQPGYFGYGQQQAYDPFSAAASNVWMDYIKKAAEASQQLYKQWDKAGASNMINAGMGYAQHWAKEAQKAYEQAMKQTPKTVMGAFQ